MEVLSWIVFGLIAGGLAKLVVSGRDPGGLIVTMLLGVAGALLGGWLGRALSLYQPGEPAGWMMSILGAVILLLIYRALIRRPASIP